MFRFWLRFGPGSGSASLKIDKNFQRLLTSYKFLQLNTQFKTLHEILANSALSVIVKHLTYLVWNFNILRISKCFICPVQKTVVEMFYSIFSSENLLFINYLSQYGQLKKFQFGILETSERMYKRCKNRIGFELELEKCSVENPIKLDQLRAGIYFSMKKFLGGFVSNHLRCFDIRFVQFVKISITSVSERRV